MFKSSWYVALGLLSACSGMAMRAPADVAAQSELVQASDRQSWGVKKGRSSFSMGPYRVDDVERQPVTQSGYSVFGFGNQRVHAAYQYAFSDGVSHREGHCAQEQDRATTSYAGKLACRCGAPGKDGFTVDIGEDAKEGYVLLRGFSWQRGIGGFPAYAVLLCVSVITLVRIYLHETPYTHRPS